VSTRRRITSLQVSCAVVVAALVLRKPLSELLDAPAVRTGSTIFVAACAQALPFLVFGSMLSGLIATFVPPAARARVLPKHTHPACGW
jgi:hypothetical protein